MARPKKKADTAARAARPTLSRELIVETALDLVREHGLDAVTLRRVAANLGTGQASLYVHVMNRQALLDLMLDRIFADLELPTPDPETWRYQVAQLITSMTVVLERYPGMARVALDGVPVGPASLAITDRILGLLHCGGVDDQTASWGVELLTQYAASSAYETAAAASTANRLAQRTGPGGLEQVTTIESLYANIDPNNYPNLTRNSALMARSSGAQRFGFGSTCYSAESPSKLPSETDQVQGPPSPLGLRAIGPRVLVWRRHMGIANQYCRKLRYRAVR